MTIQTYLKMYLHSTLFILVPRSTVSDSVPPRQGSTFHSVYISTFIFLELFLWFLNLHSTLFILVPIQIWSNHFRLWHLHSTLFILVLLNCLKVMIYIKYLHSTLFILVRHTHLMLLLVFFLSTFHSVYISTLYQTSKNGEVLNLHSTLFILVRIHES